MQTQFKIFFLKKKLFFFQIIIINNNDRHLHSHQHRFPLALTLPVFYKTQSELHRAHSIKLSTPPISSKASMNADFRVVNLFFDPTGRPFGWPDDPCTKRPIEFLLFSFYNLNKTFSYS